MKSSLLLRLFALFTVLVFVAPDSFAQRGRSSGSTASSSGTRSTGSSRGSSSARSTRPTSTRSSFRTPSTRPTYSTPRSPITQPTGRSSVSIFNSSTRGRDSRTSRSASRGTTRYHSSSSSFGSTRPTNGFGNNSPWSTETTTTPTSQTTSSSTYSSRTFTRDQGGYDDRETTSDSYDSFARPTTSPTALDIPSSTPAQRFRFPRAHQPSATTSSRPRPTIDSRPVRDGYRGSIDSSTFAKPKSVDDISQRYRGRDYRSNANSVGTADGRLAPARVTPGGRRSSGGSSYGDGPSGRLNPRAPKEPTGRLVSGQTKGSDVQDNGSKGGTQIGSRSAGPAGAGNIPARVNGDLTGTLNNPTTGGTGIITPGADTTGDDVVVTPIYPPTITTGSYYTNWNNYSAYCGSAFSWGIYGWYSSHYLNDWYWSSYYPAYYHNGFYVGYHTGTPIYIDQSITIVQAGDTTIGDDYQGISDTQVGLPAGESSPEDTMVLSAASDAYLQSGDRAFRERRYGDAVHFYAKAIEFSPNEGALYLVLADALFATGDYHYAAYAIRRALELDPTLLVSEIDKHDFYGRPSDFDQQLRVLEDYVTDHPTDTDTRLVLALNYLFGGMHGHATRLLENDFSRGLGTDPAAMLILERSRL
ncbi:MAG: hypothetical protein ACI8TQ_001800 [Planctomycetota bacterium]|jgi:hypothetical protein